MDLDTLRAQATAHLILHTPALERGAAQLVDECLASARKAFHTDFIRQLGPQAWAEITLIYFKHFVDTGVDVPVGDMFAAVIRDSIHIRRMDMLTLALAQHKQAAAAQAHKPTLSVVKDDQVAGP
ncbi:hypothetical protein G3580_17900 [Nitrogeniibacter mangrovi]|uniref:Uncharacterized protein n=1 Tax=Nitrogeniibacter mangrovi TaxID=2016596 RepID=A0A6C1B7I4_9RHOO|nr:hypothetical protein [Nitrogeniibacter mangrovi]QID19323.1 hypothetical protein G3580_17900 [Nitrogeniibacter mangrovi]